MLKKEGGKFGQDQRKETLKKKKIIRITIEFDKLKR